MNNKVMTLVVKALRERGMVVKESRIHNVVTGVEVTAPGGQGSGRVVFDRQGMLTWDYLPKNLDEGMAGQIANIIIKVLTFDIKTPLNAEPGEDR